MNGKTDGMPGKGTAGEVSYGNLDTVGQCASDNAAHLAQSLLSPVEMRTSHVQVEKVLSGYWFFPGQSGSKGCQIPSRMKTNPLPPSGDANTP